MSAEVLAKLVERVKQATAARAPSAPAPVVVFDLDGTVFDNGPRTWQILVEFAEAAALAPLRRALDALPRTGLPYLLSDTLARCGETDPAVVEKASAFWRERFFTDTYQTYDEPIVGAVALVRELFDAGATLVYLSGRDAPNMLVGCAQSLRRGGFPVGIPRTAVVLKHDFSDEDLAFKREAMSFIDELGAVVATFDNEPANCNFFAARYPRALHVFVTTAHAPNPPPLAADVVRVRDLGRP